MPLKVVTGRANAGKTGWILRWAFEALEQGVSPTLIVPTLSDVRRLQTEIASKASFGVRVVTPQNLAEELWQLHGDGRRLVGDATRAATVKRLLADISPGGAAPSAQSPGFERLLVRAARACTLVDQGHRSGREAGALVARLLQGYRDELGVLGLVEAGWIPALLADSPPEVGFLGFLRFTTFTESQLALMCSLAEKSSVGASLTWEYGFIPTRANDPVASVLMSRADEVRVAEESLGDPELNAVATWTRPSDGQPLVSGGRVLLGEARGREGEAALVASMVALAIESGVLPERIAVVFGQVAPRLGLLANAMAADGIECSFGCALTVGATPFGSALVALLKVALGRGAREDALQFLQGPFCDAEQDAVLDLDRTWRVQRRTEDCFSILSDMAELPGRSPEAVTLCRAVASREVDENSLPKWQRLTDALIETAAKHDEFGEVAGQDASAHAAVSRAVAEMAAVTGHRFGAADVLEVLPTLPCALRTDEVPGSVQVLEASEIGARRFDELIVAGLTQREFPRSSKETFAAEVRALATGRMSSADEAAVDLEFYSLLTRPRSRLALVRQTVNSDGAGQEPSALLRRVLDLYRDSREAQGTPVPGIPEVVRCEDSRACAPVFTEGRRDQRLLPAESVPSGRVATRGRVDTEDAVQLTRGRVFSATEIEAYLQCPYSWFYSRVLRPRDIDAEMDAAALGSRAHGLIAEFYEAMAREGHERVTPESKDECLELFEHTATESERRMVRAQGLAEEIDVGRAHLWARHVVEDDALLLPGYAPLGHEVTFGRDSVFEFGGVSIAGRIDRIDAGPEGVVITDYKSARDVGRLARPGDGSSIQHVLYAVAAERNLGRTVVGSVYRSLRSRQLRGFWREDLLGNLPPEACDKDSVDAAGFSAMVETLEGRIAEAVKGMSAGDIPRMPQSAGSCRFCGIQQICEGAAS